MLTSYIKEILFIRDNFYQHMQKFFYMAASFGLYWYLLHVINLFALQHIADWPGLCIATCWSRQYDFNWVWHLQLKSILIPTRDHPLRTSRMQNTLDCLAAYAKVNFSYACLAESAAKLQLFNQYSLVERLSTINYILMVNFTDCTMLNTSKKQWRNDDRRKGWHLSIWNF